MSDTPAVKYPFHLMAKPAGPACNLACSYCFYREKEALFNAKSSYKMSDNVLETYIREYIAAVPADEVNFSWQGGEPTLMGIDFFTHAIELQQKYAQGKRITNSLQTNGVLIDDEWAAFLRKHSFLVGLSLDGPPDIHDTYRVFSDKSPSSSAVLKGLHALQRHNVEYNTLTCVTRTSAKKPLDVYNFLVENGVTFMQFIPIVERIPDTAAKELGLDLAVPVEPGEEPETAHVTRWSVEPRQFGAFLNTIFDYWVQRHVGSVFVQHFDIALAQWCGVPSHLCFFAQRCGNALIIEHNGDVYACDHYMYPHYKRGNILENKLANMVYSDKQRAFGDAKETALPPFCQRCKVRFACNGGCPKHRFLLTKQGDPGLSYLCAGYKKFFTHIDAAMQHMAALIRAGRPAADIMRSENT